MNNKILTTLEAFRLAMESLLRALILADEDGSIKYLQAVLAQPKPTPPPESHLTKGDNIDASNMARRQQTPAAAARKVYANNIGKLNWTFCAHQANQNVATTRILMQNTFWSHSQTCNLICGNIRGSINTFFSAKPLARVCRPTRWEKCPSLESRVKVKFFANVVYLGGGSRLTVSLFPPDRRHPSRCGRDAGLAARLGRQCRSGQCHRGQWSAAGVHRARHLDRSRLWVIAHLRGHLPPRPHPTASVGGSRDFLFFFFVLLPTTERPSYLWSHISQVRRQ